MYGKQQQQQQQQQQQYDESVLLRPEDHLQLQQRAVSAMFEEIKQEQILGNLGSIEDIDPQSLSRNQMEILQTFKSELIQQRIEEREAEKRRQASGRLAIGNSIDPAGTSSLSVAGDFKMLEAKDLLESKLREQLKNSEKLKVRVSYMFQGSLETFQQNSESLMSTVRGGAQFSHHNIKPVIVSSRVTFLQNTTPFEIALTIKGMPANNMYFGNGASQLDEASVVLPPNVLSTIPTDIKIYDPVSVFGPQGSLDLDFYALKYHGISSADILESIDDNPDEIPADNRPQGLVFVKANSVLGYFMRDNDFTPIGNYFFVVAPEATRLAQRLANIVSNTPVGNISSSTALISRADGSENWTDLPVDMNRIDQNDYRTNTQTIYIQVEHIVKPLRDLGDDYNLPADVTY